MSRQESRSASKDIEVNEVNLAKQTNLMLDNLRSNSDTYAEDSTVMNEVTPADSAQKASIFMASAQNSNLKPRSNHQKRLHFSDVRHDKIISSTGFPEKLQG